MYMTSPKKNQKEIERFISIGYFN